MNENNNANRTNLNIDPVTLVRPEILPLRPYVSKLYPQAIKLDANENPFPWPQGMREELFAADLAFNRYPDGTAQELKAALADYTGVDSACILTGNGSDELVQLILTVFGGAGRAVIIHPPTFVMYEPAAQVTGTKVVRVPLLDGVKLDLNGTLEATENPEINVIILCSPNNPTGTLFPEEQILRIVRESGKMVVVDEAYIEFAGQSLTREISRYSNLLVMRTFSKAFGLAGLRLGYLLGQAGTIDLLNRARQPFNVNAFTQKAGVIALRYLEGYRQQIYIIKEETEKLYSGLGEIPTLRVYPTAANFLLFQPNDPDVWAQELLARGFLVRNLGQIPVLGKSLRVSAGLPEENQAFLASVREIAGNYLANERRL
ncbi:MAG: histidinol-phosphate transaminase [Desulfitobacteriaceae bacterium]